MEYKKSEFTFGSELELADVDTRLELPEGSNWDRKDYTIANSCGVCNDPKKEITVYGGEINVKPTDSVESQVIEIFKIYNALGDRKSVNHTTNFHIHVGVKGLGGDIESLKRVAEYIYKYQSDIFNITEDLVKPERLDFDNEDVYKGAKKRFNRRKISHQNHLSEKVYNLLMEATTPEEFYEAHAPLSSDGSKRLFGLTTRHGINLMQLFNETDTIEFRHFSMSFDLNEVMSCVLWCEEIVDAMLNTGISPKEILGKHDFMTFPKFVDYDYDIDKIFKLTTTGKLSRVEVKNNIEALLESGEITKEQLR